MIDGLKSISPTMHAASSDAEALTPQDEARLIESAKARSSQAWTLIYDRHYDQIYRYIKARVFSEMIAEDLAADVFVGALKRIDSYRDRGRPLLAWLYRIARNVVVSHQRKMGVANEHGLGGRIATLFGANDDGRRGDAPGPAIASASEADDIVERLDMEEALAGLPDSQREVLILRQLVGLSAQEVGDLIGKKPAAVYSLQARAIVTLRERLA